jgi:hypothetical protein
MVAGDVALENGSVDLDICTQGIDCTTLLVVACPAPGIGAKKVQESSRTNLGTYKVCSSVALEGAVVDLNSAFISINSSALEVACPPPGIRAKF